MKSIKALALIALGLQFSPAGAGENYQITEALEQELDRTEFNLQTMLEGRVNLERELKMAKTDAGLRNLGPICVEACRTACPKEFGVNDCSDLAPRRSKARFAKSFENDRERKACFKAIDTCRRAASQMRIYYEQKIEITDIEIETAEKRIELLKNRLGRGEEVDIIKGLQDELAECRQKLKDRGLVTRSESANERFERELAELVEEVEDIKKKVSSAKE